jgi:hypothetical protein
MIEQQGFESGVFGRLVSGDEPETSMNPSA